MKAIPRRLLIAAALGLTLAGVSYARPAWTQELGLDFWNVPPLEAQMRRTEQLEAVLSVRSEQALQRIAAKEELVAALLDGRLDLREVAARFKEFNGNRAAYVITIRRTFSGRDDDERLYRNVINFAEVALRGRADHDEAVRRLNHELDRLLASGDYRLPDVPTVVEPPMPISEVEELFGE